MKIDCKECRMYRTEHCDDCLVTALLHPDDSSVAIDDDVAPSIDNLSRAGLIPVLKFRPRRDEPSAPASAEAG